MSMCPYCGEDVPAGSNSCWKCGFELEDNTSPDTGEPVEIEQRNKAPRRPQQECPKCGKLVAVHAIRCNHCGVAISKGRKTWIPLVWGAFALVVLVTIVGSLYRFFAEFKPPPDPGRSTPISATRAGISKIYRGVSAHAKPKLANMWEERHNSKYVKWNGYVLEIRDDDTLALGDSSSVDRKAPHAILTLKDIDQIEERGLKVGKSILYTARLNRFEGGTVHLDMGIVED
jgi:ribosomal protein S27AE